MFAPFASGGARWKYFRMLNSYFYSFIAICWMLMFRFQNNCLFIHFSIYLQSKICTWLSADWGGCTTCPFYTIRCATRREVVATHAWRSWTNYFPSPTMVSWASAKGVLHDYKLCDVVLTNEKSFQFSLLLNFDFLISCLFRRTLHSQTRISFIRATEVVMT